MKKAIGYVVSAVALSSAFGIIQAGPALAAETVDHGLIEKAAQSIASQETAQAQTLNETRMFPISGWHEGQMNATDMSLHANTGGPMTLGIDTPQAKNFLATPKLNPESAESSSDHSTYAADTSHALPGIGAQDFMRNDLQVSIVRDVAAQAVAEAANAAAAAAAAAVIAAQQSPPVNNNPGNNNPGNNNPGVINNNPPLIEQLGDNDINNINGGVQMQIGDNFQIMD